LGPGADRDHAPRRPARRRSAAIEPIADRSHLGGGYGAYDARLERVRIRYADGRLDAALAELPSLVHASVDRLGTDHPAAQRAIELAVSVSLAAGREDRCGALRRAAAMIRPASEVVARALRSATAQIR
jgi:hypothetical protein